jgi:hypothetical protein
MSRRVVPFSLVHTPPLYRRRYIIIYYSLQYIPAVVVDLAGGGSGRDGGVDGLAPQPAPPYHRTGWPEPRRDI